MALTGMTGPGDFTLASYRAILAKLQDGFTVVDYPTAASRDQFMVWRHDVDFSLKRAMRLAQLEHEAGIRATYFIHLHSIGYNAFAPHELDRMRGIVARGHDIGLHYDPVASAATDAASAEASMRREIELLSTSIDHEIRAVSFHNPTTFDLPFLDRERIAGLVNASARWFRETVAYCSDSNGYWRHRRLHDFLDDRPERAQVLTHPVWWQDAPAPPRERLRAALDEAQADALQVYDRVLADSGRLNIRSFAMPARPKPGQDTAVADPADRVPFLRPMIDEAEVAAVSAVIRSGWIAQGPQVIRFEAATADYVGAQHGIAVNSCTSALHLVLHTLGIGPDDEVILPSFACIAAANPVHSCGATPVFADIEPHTYNLDPDAVASCITPRTRAILVVHQFGLAADIDRLADLAASHDLHLVEDAAAAFGARYRGRPVGSLAGPTCFSFYPRKMITTGEGGMITTASAQLADDARALRSSGATVSDLERHRSRGTSIARADRVGYNYRMTDMQAAMGLVQLGRIASMLAQRRDQAAHYARRMAEIDEVELPYQPSDREHAFSSYVIRIRPGARRRRDDVVTEMARRGISCRVGIPPLHREPFYAAEWTSRALPHSEEAGRTTLCLPIFPGLTVEEQDLVVDSLKCALL